MLLRKVSFNFSHSDMYQNRKSHKKNVIFKIEDNIFRSNTPPIPKPEITSIISQIMCGAVIEPNGGNGVKCTEE